MCRYAASALIRLREQIGTNARCGRTPTASRTFRFLAQLFSALYVGNVAGAFVNALAVAVLVARIMQSLVHVCFVQTDTVTSVRFGFFFVQIVSFLWLIGILLTKLSGMRITCSNNLWS